MNDRDRTNPFPGEPSRPPLPSGHNSHSKSPNDASRTLLVGLLGGIVSAVGYAVYARLPDEQKDRLHQHVRGEVETRIGRIRSNLNI